MEIKTQWEEETKIRLGAPNSSDIIMKQSYKKTEEIGHTATYDTPMVLR